LEEVYFLSSKRINCVFNYVGELKLLVSDEGPKFYQSFKQDISNLTEGEEEIFFSFKKKTDQATEKTEKKITRRKPKLTPEEIARAKQEKVSQKKLAVIRGVSDRTIRNWKKAADKPKQKRGPKFKMTKRVLVLLHFYLNDYPKSFQKKTVKYLYRKTGILFERSTISRVTKKIEFSRKKIPYRYSKQKELMPEFWKFIKRMQPLLKTSCLLAFDESGFPLNMAPTWGYAPIGERVEADKPGWGENCSLLLLIQNIGSKGVIHWKVVEGAVDALVFHNFLREIILPTNDEYHLLMDNVSFHKRVGKYREYKEKDPSFLNFPIEYQKTGLPPAPEYLASRNIKVKFITPYFPQLNPAEELFNVIKAYVREQEPRTYEKLKEVIAKKINMLQQQDLTKYFKDCLDYDFILESLESGNWFE
jgi:DNA-binding transcriptional regulator YiaG